MTQVANFTDFSIDISELKRSRIYHPPFPKGWARVVAEIDPSYAYDPGEKLESWCLRNTHGRFGYIHIYPSKAIIYFEQHSDGILFKMLDGAVACLEQ